MRLTRRQWLGTAAATIGCDGTVSQRSDPVRRDRHDRNLRSARSPSGHALLAERIPSLRLNHVALGAFPTPCQHARELSRRIGLDLWVKRDDLASGVFGGGKVRKLELLLAEAKALKRGRVITFGGAGSNQCLATALFAPRAGLQASVVLSPQPRSEPVARQLRMLAATQAEIRFSKEVGSAEVTAMTAMQRDGAAPYVLPAGGTSALGNLAFVAAALELDAQIRAGMLPEPAWLVIAAGTLGSAVGLCLGLAITQRKTRVLAVRASSAHYSNPDRARALYGETARLIASGAPQDSVPALDPDRFVFESRELGAGYGRSTRSGEQAAHLAADLEGYRLEPTYTQKALAAVLRKDRLCRTGPLLLWLTQSAVLPAEAKRPLQRLPKQLHSYLR